MKYLLTIFTLALSVGVLAQTNKQNIRGTVYDEDARSTLPGVTVIIAGSDPIVGTNTDIDGRFILEDVPVGRVDLIISFVGYETRTINNILLTSGKEVVLEIGIKESINQIDAAVVEVERDKKKTLNEMALVSSRGFTVEETKRYAGSFNDPARMVSSYAGVSSDAQGDNDIVVRGNSPKGILWRLEGVEIPNPNHFADEGATGGPINALNSSMLSDSDFLTGAFEAEYGNATSGVFDMKLRNGNNEQREYAFSFGAIGTEFAAEGPFSSGSRASYLVNYRYSSLSLLDNLGVVDFGGVPKYQDAAFKVNLPTSKAGNFSLWGFGGISHITDEWQDTTASDAIISYKDDYRANMGVIALNHLKLVGDQAFIKSNVVLSTNGSGYSFEEDFAGSGYVLESDAQLQRWNVRADALYNNKINARNRLKVGVIGTQMNYSFYSADLNDQNVMVRELDTDGNSAYLQGFVSWKHRLNEQITFVGGVHGMYLTLNETYSIEPRVAMNYQLDPQNTFAVGAGLHSKMESLLSYNALIPDEFGELTKPNIGLELPKAAHFVAGWDHSFNEHTHVKTDIYYQHLYDVPVDVNPASTFSLINQSDWFSRTPLVSEGMGRNYGMEFTLERFLSNGLYYLATASIFKSEYQSLDEQWRNTRYDANYLANLLIGKEYELKAKNNKDRTLAFNIRATLLGGDRYTPIDLDASMLQDETVRAEDKLSAKGDDVFYLNVAGTYRINREKATHEIKLEVLNATNNQARVRDYYDSDNQTIGYDYQLGLIPNLIYTVNF